VYFKRIIDVIHKNLIEQISTKNLVCLLVRPSVPFFASNFEFWEQIYLRTSTQVPHCIPNCNDLVLNFATVKSGHNAGGFRKLKKSDLS
jgi:hypothetical protein